MLSLCIISIKQVIKIYGLLLIRMVDGIRRVEKFHSFIRDCFIDIIQESALVVARSYVIFFLLLLTN